MRPAATRGHAVQPGAGARGLPRRHALRQQPADQARQHIARAAVASQGGAERLTAARPSGAAMMVSAPFSSTTAPVRAAAARAADSRSGAGAPNTRANSPPCGVSTAAPRSPSGLPAKAENTSASPTTVRAGRDQRRKRRAGFVGAETRSADPHFAARVCQQFGDRRLVTSTPGSLPR